MMLQRVCTQTDRTVRVYYITNSLTNCFMMWVMAELIAQTHSHLGIGCRRKGKGRLAEEWLFTIQPFAWEKKQFCFFWNHKSARIMWALTLSLNLRTSWMQTNVATSPCKYDGNLALLSGRRIDFCEITKVPILRDLWPRHWPWAQHTVDADLAGNHRVRVWWRSSHLPGKRSDLRKCLQMDGRCMPHDSI